MSCGIGCGSADDAGRHSGLGVTSPAARTGSTRSNARAQWQRTHVGGQVPSLGIAADSAAEIPNDGTCPPTCVRCHCARAFDLVVPVRAAGLVTPSPEWRPASSALPLPIPHDILHVPRPVLL